MIYQNITKTILDIPRLIKEQNSKSLISKHTILS